MTSKSSVASQSVPRKGKTALVLAGGGLTGAVYEIGALRAIDDLLVDRNVTDFDIFVGTSAGAFVTAMLAVGLTPREMFQALNGTHPEVRAPSAGDFFRVDVKDYVRRGLRLPHTLGKIAWQAVQYPLERSVFDIFFSLGDALPGGVYDPVGIEEFVAHVIHWTGGNSTFADLDRELYLIATELDNGERMVFSREITPHLSVARAVSASAAVPIFYKPVEIDGIAYVDGGLRGTASLDIAVEHGADLVVCINPAVPITAKGQRARRIASQGLPAIFSQAFRTVLHSSLTYQMKQLQRRHPGVDFILIEPGPDNQAFFIDNVMRYSSRITVAEQGYESVTLNLASSYEKYKAILAKHNIPITRRLVIEELQAISASGSDRRVIQQVLERTARRSASLGRKAVTTELANQLNKLEQILSDQAQN
ncbi:MAG: patatin-like phospholipase family protein [Chloroflexi bacterium]|nr:patatin-like phospholipase family protein [Chloroflexota bacterium]